MSGKRLFIAVDIDDDTRGEIERISAAVRERSGAGTKASWVTPDRMHLTLLFFGDADAVLEDRLRTALAAPIRQAPFDLAFDGLGTFPDRGAPRVLWLGIRDGADELDRLEKLLHNRLNATRDHGDFRPHLTLARFRDRPERAKLAEIRAIRASAGPCRIDRVTLYESRLSPASLDSDSGRSEAARRPGPTYLRLAEALLRP